MADDDYDLDEALAQSLAQMEANETTTTTTTSPNHTNNADNNNNTKNGNTTIIDLGNDNESEHKATTNAEDDAIMQDALNAVQESINNANDAQTNNDILNDDEMKDFFNEIYKSFANLDDDADDESLDKALKTVMSKFFDSNQLKEPVHIICEKYPKWLEENKNSLSTKDYENYMAQYELYSKADVLLQSSTPDTSQIMDILLKTFSYGSLPTAVMDGMMPDELKQFADQMEKFEKNLDKQDNDTTTLDRNNETNDVNTTNNKSNENNNDKSTQNNNNNNNNNNNDNRSDGAADNEDEMNKEAMKFFQQLIGMQNNGTTDDQKDNDFMPNLNDLPKLNDEEMKQFKQLMNQDNCSIM